MIWTIVLALAVALALLFLRLGFLSWVAAGAVLLVGWRIQGIESPVLFVLVAVVLLILAAIFGLPPLRRALISRVLMPRMASMLPRLGETERIALEAGTVDWDGDLFSGRPNWQRLLDYPVQALSDREQAFLDGPVTELCKALDDWQIQQDRDLPPEIWERLKRDRFFGMIIPERYDGLGFSHIGHARVVTRIATRSVTCAVTVMVPNSLGPAELLMQYGTDEQKQHYLPRLARGEEIPCFALTGPEAGSDAAATQCEGVVCHGEWEGEQVLGLRLNWLKRYITLSPVATVIGLAFQMRDPDGLIGDTVNLGITCALIPRGLEGIEIGQRHDPMGVPFHNGPIVGRDVFVPLDAIIGGRDGAGQGWRMLMECLAAGRSISLPALSVGAAQAASRVVGAYATVREQFDTPIGRFEGIEEPLARIGGMTYVMTAARTFGCAALDNGQKPAVISAILKAYLTQGMRDIIIDAMDIRAGAAIQRGPRNMLARAWSAVPIGITVEGANILTRSMIIYGQGAIRCHPFVEAEIRSVQEEDLKAFDVAIFGHINYSVTAAVRAFLLALTGSRLAGVPRLENAGLTRCLQHLSRFSAAFALISDTAMGTLGGTLKRREKISGRLADALAWMYLASATIKRYHGEGKSEFTDEMAQWGCYTALYNIQEALLGVTENLPMRPAGALLRILVFPLGARFRPPGDRLGGRVARHLLEDREGRLRLTEDVHVPGADEVGLGALEAALQKAVGTIPIETKLRDAVRAGNLDRAPGQQLADNGLAAGVISQAEYDLLNEAREARFEVIQVDAFDADVYATLR